MKVGFFPRPQLEFPWAKHEIKPPSISHPIKWLTFQSKLHSLGYSDAKIVELYNIQVGEWKNPDANKLLGTEMNSQPSVPQQVSPKTTSTDEDLAKWLDDMGNSKTPVNPNPFAIQPPKEINKKFRRLPNEEITGWGTLPLVPGGWLV